MAGRRHPYVILGAGCAGLSLCYYLLQQGVTDPILILDEREEFTDDRTWCFWNVRPNPFVALATHCWHGWRVYGPQGEEVCHQDTSVGYARLRGIDFYRFVLAALSEAPNVTLRLGERVECCSEEAETVRVRTAREEVLGSWVFDSRATAPGRDGLRQHFRGQVLRSSVPAFDPACPTLMDFRVTQEGGLRFFYVLPFSSTEALVENTCLGGAALSPETHRAEITDYARRFLGVEQFEIVHEEAGSIPMSAERVPLRRGKRVFPIGQAGGASKPSSGYTFLRIQEHCQHLAQAVAAGTMQNVPRRFAPARFAFYDAALLAALRSHPERFPAYFFRLFQSVAPDALARFLSETSTWRDEWQVTAALPPAPFLRAALAATPQWLPHLFP